MTRAGDGFDGLEQNHSVSISFPIIYMPNFSLTLHKPIKPK